MNGHLGSFLLAAAVAVDNGKLTLEIYLVRHSGKKLLLHLHRPLRSARLVPEFSRDRALSRNQLLSNLISCKEDKFEALP